MPLFSTWTKPRIARLTTILAPVTATAGHVLMRQGNPPDAVLLVRKGTVELRVRPWHLRSPCLSVPFFSTCTRLTCRRLCLFARWPRHGRYPTLLFLLFQPLPPTRPRTLTLCPQQTTVCRGTNSWPSPKPRHRQTIVVSRTEESVVGHIGPGGIIGMEQVVSQSPLVWPLPYFLLKQCVCILATLSHDVHSVCVRCAMTC